MVAFLVVDAVVVVARELALLDDLVVVGLRACLLRISWRNFSCSVNTSGILFVSISYIMPVLTLVLVLELMFVSFVIASSSS